MATIERGISSHFTHGNVLNTHVHLMTTNTWTPLMVLKNYYSYFPSWKVNQFTMLRFLLESFVYMSLNRL